MIIDRKGPILLDQHPENARLCIIDQKNNTQTGYCAYDEIATLTLPDGRQIIAVTHYYSGWITPWKLLEVVEFKA